MLNEKYLNKVIDFAWADEISFDSIKEQTGLNEKQVIKLMRSNLKPRSFKLWRERVSGRKSKHSKINNNIDDFSGKYFKKIQCDWN